MNLTSDPILIGQSLFDSKPVAQHPLGTKGVTRDGRRFRYVQAGAVTLVTGNALQSAAQDTAHQNLTPTADQPIGSTTIIATLGASAAAENQYAGGLAIISTTPGLGFAYAIKSHAAVLSAGVITLKLADDSPLQVAITLAASKVDLVMNVHKGVIQAPAAVTGAAVGGCVFPILANEFGWIQTGKQGAALSTGIHAVGHVLSIGSTAGALVINSTTLPIVAHAMDTGVAGRVQAVYWLLD